MDLVLAGNGGPRLLIQQPDGRLVDATVEASAGGVFTGAGYFGVWAADIEMDGDLDIVAGANDDTAIVLRNNGNGTWRRLGRSLARGPLCGVTWTETETQTPRFSTPRDVCTSS